MQLALTKKLPPKDETLGRGDAANQLRNCWPIGPLIGLIKLVLGPEGSQQPDTSSLQLTLPQRQVSQNV